MRGKPKTWLDGVRRFTPWVWRKCSICGHEFRKENGYKIKWVHSATLNGMSETKHLCSECAPDLRTAKKEFQKLFEIPEIPERPAPPPRPPIKTEQSDPSETAMVIVYGF
jgi:rubredoxin